MDAILKALFRCNSRVVVISLSKVSTFQKENVQSTFGLTLVVVMSYANNPTLLLMVDDAYLGVTSIENVCFRHS